jgi:small subunit ribosomal protein S17
MAAEEVKATTEKKADAARGRPKTRIGVVTSNKMQKTVVVKVQRRVMHPKYGKYVMKAVKYKAHAESHDYPKSPTINEGDVVRIAETRPASKDKRWRVVETVRKAVQV